MSPNIRRMMPLFAVLAAVLFIVPALTKKHTSGLSSNSKATLTKDALNRVGKSEDRYLKAHGRYTSHLADLVTLDPALGTDLVTVQIQVDAGSDGQAYLAQASTDVLSLAVHATGPGTARDSCTVLKTSKGVSCPASTIR